MTIYIGSDHRGYKMKQSLSSFLSNKGYQLMDMGPEEYDETDDYPDVAVAVSKKVSLEYENSRGILICGSGVGVDVVANKFKNVRSALVCSSDQAFDSRNDDDSNVLSLPADYLNLEEAQRITLTWLQTPFSGEERHRRRLNKVQRVEQELCRNVDQDSFTQ